MAVGSAGPRRPLSAPPWMELLSLRQQGYRIVRTRKGAEVAMSGEAHYEEECQASTARRTVIVHYHLFKCAGTSVDRMLKRHFADRWVCREFESVGNENTRDLLSWIDDNPDAVAFSSHTLVGPMPERKDLTIVPILFLRDPIARIRSAYLFERSQGADTHGSKLARTNDFFGYVKAHLQNPWNRQCRNFQTSRLAMLLPGNLPEITRASSALLRLPFVGLVDEFDRSMARFNSILPKSLALTDLTPEHANASSGKGDVVMEAGLRKLLEVSNRDDIELIEIARALADPGTSPRRSQTVSV